MTWRAEYGLMAVRRWGRLLLAALLVAGCAAPEPLLFDESPFETTHLHNPADVIIITVRGYAFDLPAEARLGWWDSDPCAVAADEPADWPTPGQREVWTANGLAVRAVREAAWPDLRAQLVAAGGAALPTMTTMIRRSDEVVEFPTFAPAAERMVFVSDAAGRMRGYTVPAGQSFFQVAAAPVWAGAQRRVQLALAPILRSTEVQERFDADDFGAIRRVARRPEIAFEQLHLDVMLDNDAVLCIGARPGSAAAGRLGQAFLMRRSATDNRQVVLVLAPRVQTAAELKTAATP